MRYCVVDENNIIQNIIVADSSDAINGVTLLEAYNSAEIGSEYNNPNNLTNDDIVQMMKRNMMTTNEQIDAIYSDLAATIRAGVNEV